MTVQAVGSGFTGACVCHRHVNGGPQAAARTYAIGSDPPSGAHRLDLVVVTSPSMT